MDFIDRVRELSAQIPKITQRDLIKTEEGTKNALIMPFINALGYNVFDPTEVTPELVADVGTKKGEKVDYAILRDGKPIMLFECKCCGTTLALNQASQLYRYFSVTSARFGILTDGIIYQFFTDLEAPNKMDTKPFFVFNMLDFTDSDVEELKKFTKSSFDEGLIVTTASELKYRREMKRYLGDQLEHASDEFVRLLLEGSQVHSGRKTQNVLGDFRAIVEQAFREFISEQLETKLKTIISGNVRLKPEQGAQTEDDTVQTPAATAAPEEKVVTTDEEKEGFIIIRALLRPVLAVNRIAMRDAQSYCAIFVDNNNRKPIARLYFNGSKKSVGVFNADKQEERVYINSLDDIYDLVDRLRATAALYVEPSKETV